MKATLMYGAGDVRVETIPDAGLLEPTDALVRVTHAAICGSDLWPYKLMAQSETGCQRGHEFIGFVEAIGAAVRTIKRGDSVVAPFAFSDGNCLFCHDGIHTSCIHVASVTARTQQLWERSQFLASVASDACRDLAG
jgi:threonine dehydrogenase-like Zn-dependent dehydrogenase